MGLNLPGRPTQPTGGVASHDLQGAEKGESSLCQLGKFVKKLLFEPKAELHRGDVSSNLL